jgi:hypothetical protein
MGLFLLGGPKETNQNFSKGAFSMSQDTKTVDQPKPDGPKGSEKPLTQMQLVARIAGANSVPSDLRLHLINHASLPCADLEKIAHVIHHLAIGFAELNQLNAK